MQAFAVFVLVRVNAPNKERAAESVAIMIDNARGDDTFGLKPVGEITSYELQETIEA